MEILVALWLALLGYAVDQEYDIPAGDPAVTECLSISPARACEGGDKGAGPSGVPDTPTTPEPPTEPPEPPEDGDHDKGHGNEGGGEDPDNPSDHPHDGPPGQN